MNIFRKFFAYLRLREAVRMANHAHNEFGQRFYVMPQHGSGGKLLILDRKNFRLLKSKHYINSEARVVHLLNECFYYTPRRDEKGGITKEMCDIKTRQFFDWYEFDRKAYRALKSRRG